MIKTVIYDIDGVIFNRDKAELESLNKIYNELKINKDNTFIVFLNAWKNANKVLWEQCSLKKVIPEDVLYLRWVETFKLLEKTLSIKDSIRISNYYLDLYCNEIYGVKEVIQIINKLYQNGTNMGVITNGVKKIQYDKLNRLGLINKFNFIITDQESKFRKPDERMFLYALDFIQAKADEVIYIGNSLEDDIYPAKSLGIKAVWYDCNDEVEHSLYEKLDISKLKDINSLIS